MTDEIRAGAAAKTVLDDEVFQRTVDMVDEAIVAQWRAATSPAERERAHMAQDILQMVVKGLRVTAQKGETELTLRKRAQEAERG